MKTKLIVYLFLYAAVITFIAMSMENSEATLGKKASVVCEYNTIKDGKVKAKENYLEVVSKKLRETGDSVYISILIYNRGSENLLLKPATFLLMSKSGMLSKLQADSINIYPEKQKEVIVGYSCLDGTPDRIDVVRCGRVETKKIFTLKL